MPSGSMPCALASPPLSQAMTASAHEQSQVNGALQTSHAQPPSPPTPGSCGNGSTAGTNGTRVGSATPPSAHPGGRGSGSVAVAVGAAAVCHAQRPAETVANADAWLARTSTSPRSALSVPSGVLSTVGEQGLGAFDCSASTSDRDTQPSQTSVRTDVVSLAPSMHEPTVTAAMHSPKAATIAGARWDMRHAICPLQESCGVSSSCYFPPSFLRVVCVAPLSMKWGFRVKPSDGCPSFLGGAHPTTFTPEMTVGGIRDEAPRATVTAHEAVGEGCSDLNHRDSVFISLWMVGMQPAKANISDVALSRAAKWRRK